MCDSAGSFSAVRRERRSRPPRQALARLTDRSAAGRTETVRLIVNCTDAEVTEITNRHGARVAKRLAIPESMAATPMPVPVRPWSRASPQRQTWSAPDRFGGHRHPAAPAPRIGQSAGPERRRQRRHQHVIAAIDWSIGHRAQYQLRIINLSLGHTVFGSYREDPLSQAVQRAVGAGMVLVAAAGNFGNTEDGKAVIGGIVSPGNTPAAVTAGASDAPSARTNVMATYSSRGPRLSTACSSRSSSPRATASSRRRRRARISRGRPAARVVSGQRSAGYIEMSGMSMSTAVVSGALPLLLRSGRR